MNNDFQSRLDRIEQWPIFQISWPRIQQLVALRLCDMCALSVGLHPSFAELVQEMTTVSMGDDLPADIADIATYQNPIVENYRERVIVAVNHLAPFGALTALLPEAKGGESPLRIVDFVDWALGMGWRLPDELERMGSDRIAPPSREAPLATRERSTLLTILAAVCDYSAIDPAERGAAPQIAKLTEDIGAPISDDTIRKVLGNIPDALGSRVK